MFRVARAVLLSMRVSEDFVCAEKLSAAEQIKPDCCRTPAVVSILLTPLPGSVSFDTPPPLHYISFFVFLHLCLSLWTDVGFFADDYYVAYGYWLLVV